MHDNPNYRYVLRRRLGKQNIELTKLTGHKNKYKLSLARTNAKVIKDLDYEENYKFYNQLRLQYTSRGVSRPSDVASPVYAVDS